MDAPEIVANDFLELSSEQRLQIVLRLLENRSKISVMAKELGATMPEVYRNFERLVKADIIRKNSDDYYSLTPYGKMLCSQIPAMVFVSTNKNYFKNHDFGNIPTKFVQRMGALASGKYYKGFTRVIEKWREICENANEYLYDILYEEPLELMEPVVNKAKKGVKINSIFSPSSIIPKDRKQIADKLGVKKLVEDGLIERKIKDGLQVVVVLNEKEACVMFPTANGETDMSGTFYSNDPSFHEWCLDYFRYCWHGSDTFQESKLKQ